jgi:hypothetical protein
MPATMNNWGPAALIVFGYLVAALWQNRRMDDLRDSLTKRIDDLGNALNKRIDDLASSTNSRLQAIENRLTSIESRLVEVEKSQRAIR